MLVALALSAQSASASSGEPVLGANSVSGLTSTGATIEAEIDPNGEQTTYKIYVRWSSPFAFRKHRLPRFSRRTTVAATGTLPAGTGPQKVSAHVGLPEGVTFEYEIEAANRSGTESARSDFFNTPPEGGTGEPWLENLSVSQKSTHAAVIEATFDLEGNEGEYGTYLAWHPVGRERLDIRELARGDLTAASGSESVVIKATGLARHQRYVVAFYLDGDEAGRATEDSFDT